ncbi:MAG: acyl-CoA thioesterase [Gammaproteobacteria bacterium]|nr:acyl-CoA thioesterase [Gammaproteobacteria bacterium]
MENHKLVLPEHLNHYGYLFGGNLLKWVDEYAWIAATLEHPGCKFVTIGLDKVEFRKSVREGAILRFDIRLVKQGSTSVRYQVTVYADDPDSGEEQSIFSTVLSFVCLDSAGNKRAINKSDSG